MPFVVSTILMLSNILTVLKVVIKDTFNNTGYCIRMSMEILSIEKEFGINVMMQNAIE